MCSWTARPSGTHELVPDGCMDLLWVDNGVIMLCGPETSAWTFALPPGLRAAGIRFRPSVAPALFAAAGSELFDRRVPLDELVSSSDHRNLVDEMHETSHPLAVLETFVRSRLSSHPGPDLLDIAIAELCVAPETPPTSAIADGVGLTQRQVHRRSLRAFGYGPATLRKLVRFQRFILAAQRSRQPIAASAALAGYADQSHLVRDCRSITGRPPTVFLSDHGVTFPEMSDPYKTPD